MRYNITSQQFDFFHKEGWIVFEGLFSEEEAETIRSLLDQAKKNSSRDLERGNPPLHAALKLKRIGQAASQLINKKRVKLAFTDYPPSFKGAFCLEEISPVSETYGCCLIHLSDDPYPELHYLPKKIGDVGFYQKKFPIDFPKLESPFLFLAFAAETARYILQANDPNTHFLKKLGYGFGDHLTTETHPLITS